MAKKKASVNKKEQFTKKKGTSIPLIFGGVAVAIAVLVGATFALNTKGGGQASSSAVRKKVSDPQTYAQSVDMTDIPSAVEDGKVVVDLDDVKKNLMVGFTYPGSQISVGGANVDMPLVAFIDNNGKLNVSVAMCEPCKSIRFHIESDNTLTCNTCGAKWNLNDMSPVSGSCAQYPPEEQEYKVKGGKITIDETVLKSWSQRV